MSPACVAYAASPLARSADQSGAPPTMVVTTDHEDGLGAVGGRRVGDGPEPTGPSGRLPPGGPDPRRRCGIAVRSPDVPSTVRPRSTAPPPGPRPASTLLPILSAQCR